MRLGKPRYLQGTAAMRTIANEPTIAEMLSDPIVGLLMDRDGVTAEDLRQLLAETQSRLRQRQGGPTSSRLRPAAAEISASS